ncbi:MAG: trypsin-like peptidase domain-containing protein [Propionibacteriaceae bacterium]|nr:trypsin-like peptidase domain-containing protein [Propionibacteriaceae bacterium]
MSNEQTTPMPQFQPPGPSFQNSGYQGPGQYGPSFQSSAPPPRPTQYPPYQPPSQPQPGPTRTKARRGVGVAGVLAIATLAAGIGGGSGFVASRYLAPTNGTTPAIGSSASPSTSPSATTETTEAPAGGQQTTVVQADPTNPNWSAVAEVASKAVVAIQVSGGAGSGSQGSGVVIDGAGHIVTNNHVVASAGQGAQVAVLLGTTAYQAEAVGFDPSTDLAVIKLTNPPSDLAVMGYGDSKAVKVGDPVMAIGNPLGLADTVTTGIVSALNRPVTTRAVTNQNMSSTRDNRVVTAAIQTNAAINPGNSGGALVNASGELIGITSSIASLPTAGQDQAGNIGIGFAIGSDQVSYVVEQLIATGTAQHPQLGVSASDIQTFGPMGAEVVEVVPGSPAEAAGMQVGDQVTAVDGQPVTSTESLVALVRAGRVGEVMNLTVLRGGKELTVPVTPTAAPQ